MYLLSVCLLDLVRNGEKMVDIIEVSGCWYNMIAHIDLHLPRDLLGNTSTRLQMLLTIVLSY